MNTQFLPVSKADMRARGWEDCDFLIITGDAYVDHPSFGPAIISRVLEAEGYRVAVLAQPDWKDPAAFTALGRPRLGVMVSGGNIDSMVAHYTAAKRKRRGKRRYGIFVGALVMVLALVGVGFIVTTVGKQIYNVVTDDSKLRDRVFCEGGFSNTSNINDGQLICGRMKPTHTEGGTPLLYMNKRL